MKAKAGFGGVCTLLTVACAVAGGGRGVAADTADGLANWFEIVAEAERLAQQEADTQRTQKPGPEPDPSAGRPQPPPRPVAVEAPASTVDPNALRSLIDRRNRHVNEKLFATVKKLAGGRKPMRQEIQALQAWFVMYGEMRSFVPVSRRDPNLDAVIGTFEDAVRRRPDFLEGRILAALCLMYAGRPVDAGAQLQEASKSLTERNLNPTPFGMDCCAAWMRLGEAKAVDGFIGVLKDERIVPEAKLTSDQATLIAVHAWHTYRFHDAKKYFEIALRRAKAFDKGPIPPGVQAVLADVAIFYLVAGNDEIRDAKRGAMLLGKVGSDIETWSVRRARAACAASEAAAAAGDDAVRLWEMAVKELEACRQDSLPTLDAEIDEQLAKYRAREPWSRDRPKVPPKPDKAAAGPPLRLSDRASRETIR